MPQLSTSLEESDPEMFDVIEREKHRQMTGLQLIPSEVRLSCRLRLLLLLMPMT
jgi:glycine/serine hydroxymethyltransferase